MFCWALVRGGCKAGINLGENLSFTPSFNLENGTTSSGKALSPPVPWAAITILVASSGVITEEIE